MLPQSGQEFRIVRPVCVHEDDKCSPCLLDSRTNGVAVERALTAREIADVMLATDRWSLVPRGLGINHQDFVVGRQPPRDRVQARQQILQVHRLLIGWQHNA